MEISRYGSQNTYSANNHAFTDDRSHSLCDASLLTALTAPISILSHPYPVLGKSVKYHLETKFSESKSHQE